MSRLAELIKELCPDGVEYRPLGEIADLQRGGGMPKKLFVDKGIPAIHYGHIFTKYGIQTKCAAAYLAPEDADKLTRVYPGDLVVANTSENLEDVGKGVVWLGEAEGVTGGHATVVRSLAVDTVFLSYYLRTEDFALKKRKYAQGTKVIELSAANLSKIDIPLPPLEVQREIVRILDQFTTLEAELEAELEARRTQYEHYRNRLLSYESLADCGPVSLVPLRECIELCFGERITKTQHAGTLYPVYGGGGASFMTDSFNRADEFVISRFALSEACVRFVPGEFWLLDSGITFNVNELCCDKRYVGQFLLSRQNDIYRRSAGAAQRNLKIAEFLSMEVPLPGLAEQRRIADLLDRFDALVNDISSGLPAEIAARRAQYEHYRDRLLSFPEKKAE